MGTQTAGDTEILLDLEYELRDAEKCEHSGHWWRTARHSDDSGAWLVLVFCVCHPPEEMIMCGKFKNWCQQRTDVIVTCNTCKRDTSPAQAYQWIRKL